MRKNIYPQTKRNASALKGSQFYFPQRWIRNHRAWEGRPAFFFFHFFFHECGRCVEGSATLTILTICAFETCSRSTSKLAIKQRTSPPWRRGVKHSPSLESAEKSRLKKRGRVPNPSHRKRKGSERKRTLFESVRGSEYRRAKERDGGEHCYGYSMAIPVGQ